MGYKGRIVTISIVIFYSIFQVVVLNEVLIKQLLDMFFSILLALFFGYHYDKTKFLAERDLLTKLYTRRYGITYFNKLEDKITKEDCSIAIFFLDINNFKKINDNYGHNVGDAVLKKIANILLEHKRKNDIVIRWGGDEFVIISRDFCQNDASRFIKRITEIHIEELKDFEDVNLGISIGYAIFPADGKNLDGLLKVADSRMYQAKIKQRKG